MNVLEALLREVLEFDPEPRDLLERVLELLEHADKGERFELDPETVKELDRLATAQLPDESEKDPVYRYYVKTDEGKILGPMCDYDEAAYVADRIHGLILQLESDETDPGELEPA